MESRKRIGLYGSGEVPRSRRLMSRSVGPKSKGLRDVGRLPPIRRIWPTKLATKTIAAAAAAPLAAVLLIATFVLATSMVPVIEVDMSQVPQPPFTMTGFAFDNTGAFATNVPCTITNVNTSEVINAMTDPDFGLILSVESGSYPDLANEFPGGIANGNVIRIDAQSGGWMGTNQTTIVDVGAGSIWLNVTLNLVIPEFGDVALPVVGMVGMFLIVAVAARSKKDE